MSGCTTGHSIELESCENEVDVSSCAGSAESKEEGCHGVGLIQKKSKVAEIPAISEQAPHPLNVPLLPPHASQLQPQPSSSLHAMSSSASGTEAKVAYSAEEYVLERFAPSLQLNFLGRLETAKSHPGIFLVLLALLAFICACVFFPAGSKKDQDSAGLRSPGPASPTQPSPYSPPRTSTLPGPSTSPSLQTINNGSIAMMTSSGSRHLSPGLVVPQGSECILAVPSLEASLSSGGTSSSRLDVQTLDGKAVIQADIVTPNSPNAGQRPLVALWTAHTGAPCLAYCQASPDFRSYRAVSIYDTNRELFATITKAGSPRYLLTLAHDGLKFEFEGDHLGHAVSVKNSQGKVVAESTPTVSAVSFRGTHYQLRVVSNIDVGLMLCAVFAIDFMEMA